MSGSGAKYINPRHFANDGAGISGDLAISGMPRLTGLLSSNAGEAAYELSFSQEQQDVTVIRGQVTATVEVVCQRCLEPMRITVEATVHAAVVPSDDDANLPSDLEPVLMEHDRLSLDALVEDELILALPSAPVHPPGKCRPPADVDSHEAAGSGPFGVLSTLKSGDDSGG